MHRSMIAAFVLAGALSATASGPVFADGMPSRGGPGCCALSWTGFYVGVHAGYGWGGSGDIQTSYLPSPASFNGQPFATGIDPRGFLGGGQIGYNLQAGSLVYGVEADLSWSNVEDSARSAPFLLFGGAPLNNGSSHAFRQELDWLGTVRARLGFLVSPSTLAYVTGGLAYGRTSYSAFSDIAPPNPQLQFAGSERKTDFGWTIGAGAEMRLGSNWSLKGEYLYYDLGDETVTARRVGFVANDTNFVTSRFETSGHIARVGINYKFGSDCCAPLK